MKKKLSAIILSTMLLVSCLIPSALSVFAASNPIVTAPIATPAVSQDTVQPGSNETQLNFNFCSISSTGSVEIRKAGSAASTAKSYATTAATDATNAFYYTLVSNATVKGEQYYYHKVTVSGLAPSTEYFYRYVTAAGSTREYSIKTGNSSAFSYFVVGDPQMGTGGATSNANLDANLSGWTKTLDLASTRFPDTSFIVSAGDQVESSGNVAASEAQYNYFFAPEALKHLPLAPSQGNHDTGIPNYGYKYNRPNTSSLGSSGANSVGDYWYTYGGALFMDLNSNNYNATYTLQHKQFMQDAIAANPGAKWKIVVFHHGPYTESTSHANDNDQVNAGGRRQEWIPIFDELEIDVVLNGHDHSYTRTYQMKGNAALDDQKWLNPEHTAVQDPTGTLYIETNFSSGSKYYDFPTFGDGFSYTVDTAFFSAVRHQENKPEISRVEMTDNSFTIKTYVADGNNPREFDAYTIQKTGAAVDGPSAKATIRANDAFTVKAGLSEATHSNTATVTFTYDAIMFNFIKFAPANGEQVLVKNTMTPGVAKFCVAVQDGITTDYGTATFAAKGTDSLQNGLQDIGLAISFVDMDAPGDKVIRTVTNNSSIFTNTVSLDDEFDLIALSDIIEMFGMDEGDQDWSSLYRPYDFNDNCSIDIDDITLIAQRIIL